MTFRCPSSLVILLSPHISAKGDWNKRSTKCVIVTTWTWRPTHHLGQRLDRGRTQQRSRGRSRGGRWALSNAPGNPPQGFYIIDNNPPQRLYIVDIWSTSTFISFCRTILPASLRPSPLHASHRPAVRNIEHFSLAGSSWPISEERTCTGTWTQEPSSLRNPTRRWGDTGKSTWERIHWPEFFFSTLHNVLFVQ